MQNKWIERIKTLFALLGPFAFVCGGYFYIKKNKELATYPSYTIGTVTRTSYVVGPSSHDVAFFVYTVNDSLYSTSTSNKISNGESRFLVKFSSRDPALCRFYKAVPIPDSIQTAPPGGWTKPPFPVPAEVLE